MHEWPVPANSKQVQSFNWLSVELQEIRKGGLRYCKATTKAMQEKQTFQMDRRLLEMFEQLKNTQYLPKYFVGKPMERLYMDILGPLPITQSGNRYILIIADLFY